MLARVRPSRRDQAADTNLTSSARVPLAVGRDRDPVREAVFVERRRRAGGDRRRALERLPPIRQQEPILIDLRAEEPFLSSASLTSNRSAKSLAASMRTSSRPVRRRGSES